MELCLFSLFLDILSKFLYIAKFITQTGFGFRTQNIHVTGILGILKYF